VDSAPLARLYDEHLADLAARYAAFLESAGLDAVVLHSGSLKKRSEFDDQYWPLRATPHFQHWLPLAEPDCALVIVSGQKPKLIWAKEQTFWETPPPRESDHWQRGFDIVPTTSAASVKEHMPSGRVVFVGEDHARAAEWGFAPDQVAPKEIVQKLDQLRVRKTAYEIMCLEEANRRAARGHDVLANAFRSGDASELELHLLYLRATGQDDPETPYKNIVALGHNAATLHHISYGRQPARGLEASALLVDAGATCLGYCSDITRTWVKGGGAAPSAFASLVASVEKFQKKLCKQIAVGNKYEALHEEAHREVAGALRDAGVTKLSAEEAVSTGLTRAFFPHGLGHSLGLQCHDVGCALVKPKPENPFLRNTTVIAKDQVFTIEPGIYFIDALLEKVKSGPQAASVDWKLVAELSKMGGVRIEDDVVVTGDKTIRNLTREFLP
jgi:Xaa-Pro dipeptidase